MKNAKAISLAAGLFVCQAQATTDPRYLGSPSEEDIHGMQETIVASVQKHIKRPDIVMLMMLHRDDSLLMMFWQGIEEMASTIDRNTSVDGLHRDDDICAPLLNSDGVWLTGTKFCNGVYVRLMGRANENFVRGVAAYSEDSVRQVSNMLLR
jgi:hypothetical protein